MARRFSVVPAVLVFGMAVLVSPASADPILIMGGSVIIEGRLSNHVQIHGTQGFTADMVLGTVNGEWLCTPCGPPGTSISFNGFLNTSDGGGTVEFDGVSYPTSGTGVGAGTAMLYLRPFGGPVILPPLGPSAVLSAPFELQSAASFLFLNQGGPSLAAFPLVGKGIATIELTANRFGTPVWELERLRYDFEPVPEPATLLLFGTGMLTLAARRYRHQPIPPARTGD